MKKDIADWTPAECFLLGAALASSRHFFAGGGTTGKKFMYYQSLDGKSASIIKNENSSVPIHSKSSLEQNSKE